MSDTPSRSFSGVEGPKPLPDAIANARLEQIRKRLLRTHQVEWASEMQSAYGIDWRSDLEWACARIAALESLPRELDELVAAVKTAWRPDEPDDAQGVQNWRDERKAREARLLAAEQWGKPFDEALWFSETRAALLELAALAIAQVESLDRAARSVPAHPLTER